MSVGMELSFVADLQAKFEHMQEEGISSLAIPLFHPRFQFRNENSITRSDMVLDSRGWTSSVVGVLSKWIDVDSPFDDLQKRSEVAFKQEIAWATHLSVPAIVLGTPKRNCVQLAHLVNQVANSAMYMMFWMRVPLMYEGGELNGDRGDPWEAWNTLRTMCEFHPKIGVALEVTMDLPEEVELERWIGEPITAVMIPTSVFLTNKKGYPTLSLRHQEFIGQLMKHNVKCFLKGTAYHDKGMLPYAQYIGYLKTKYASQSPQGLFEAPYLDVLQAPLQPLMDNLESQTYETFERDPIKYAQYEKAITDALKDFTMDAVPVVMVVGAGRGPLVKAALRAAETTKRTIKVFAIEKNPNAVITLRNMKITDQWHNVTIVATDMRHWKATEKADIMVSELLGSFGDNELSPECLDGAQAFLKDTGISIPCKYTSYVAPISSSKLWNAVKVFDTLKSFETPYVVRLHNVYQPCESTPCFEFVHPNQSDCIDNRRNKAFEFTLESSATIHGFAGYFGAHLYGEHYISINPANFSEGMFSWFPLYFPLRQPIYAPAGSTIEAHFWRKCNSSKVWYEWTSGLKSQVLCTLHNPNGRSYYIGL